MKLNDGERVECIDEYYNYHCLPGSLPQFMIACDSKELNNNKTLIAVAILYILSTHFDGHTDDVQHTIMVIVFAKIELFKCVIVDACVTIVL